MSDQQSPSVEDIQQRALTPEQEKLFAEAAKLRAEARELGRLLVFKPAFWGALVPIVAVGGSVYAGYATNFFQVQRDKVEAERNVLRAETLRLEIDKARIVDETAILKAENEKLRRDIELSAAAVYIKNLIDETGNANRVVDDAGRLILEVQENPQREIVVQMVREAIADNDDLILRVKFYRVLIIATDDQTVRGQFETLIKDASRDLSLMQRPFLWRAVNPVGWEHRLGYVGQLNIDLVMGVRDDPRAVRQFFEVVASLNAALEGNPGYLRHHEYIRLLHAHDRIADLDAMAVSTIADADAGSGARVNALWALAFLNPKKYIAAAAEIVALEPSGNWMSILETGLRDARSVMEQVTIESALVEDLEQVEDLPQWMEAHAADFQGAAPGVAWNAASFQ